MKTLKNIDIKRQITSSKSIDTIWYITLIICLVLIVTIQSLAKNNVLAISNFYIPDSYTYELRLLGIKDIETAGLAAQIYNIFNITRLCEDLRYSPANLILGNLFRIRRKVR